MIKKKEKEKKYELTLKVRLFSGGGSNTVEGSSLSQWTGLKIP